MNKPYWDEQNRERIAEKLAFIAVEHYLKEYGFPSQANIDGIPDSNSIAKALVSRFKDLYEIILKSL